MLSRDEVLRQAKATMELRLKTAREYPDRVIKMYEDKVAVMTVLQSLGIKCDLSDYEAVSESACSFTVPKEKLQAIRGALDTRLQLAGKNVQSEKDNTISVMLSLDGYKGVMLRYITALTEKDKCVISRESYPTLACKPM